MYNAAEIVNIVSFIPEGFCAGMLYNAFGEPAGRGDAGRGASAVWLLCRTACFFAFTVADGMTALVKLCIYISVMLLYSLCRCRGDILRRIFPAVQFIAAAELSVHAVCCLNSAADIFGGIVYSLVMSGKMSPKDIDGAYAVYTFVSETVIISAKVLLIYTASKLIIKYGGRPRTAAETAACMLPSAVGIAVSALIRVILVTVENGYTTVIYSRYPVMNLIVPLISLLLMVSVIMTCKSVGETAALQEARAERTVLEDRLHMLESYVAERDRLYESVRAFRHDMNNSMTALRDMIARKLPEDKEITDYFSDMRLSAEPPDSLVSTGSSTADAVISGKFREALGKMPRIRLDGSGFIFDESRGIKAYHMGVILSNALDNAAEACKRLCEADPSAELFITVRSYKRKNMFFAEISNSFDGILAADGSCFPVSSKGDGSLHGIGLKNIASCAEKYSGCVDITAENGCFTLTVMMKCDK